MDPLKKELEDQHQKTLKSLHLKYLLIEFSALLPLIAFLLYVKLEEADMRMSIALCLYILFTLPIGILNIMKIRKLKKEHKQQMAELDIED